MMSQPSYECNECGAPVKPSDRFCPNGHDLSKVGKKIKLTLAEAITVSTKLVTSSTSTVTRITEVQDSIQTSTTLPPQARDQYFEELDEIKTEVRDYSEQFQAMTTLLEEIQDQTKPKEDWEWLFEQIKSNIVGFFVGLILGMILRSFRI